MLPLRTPALQLGWLLVDCLATDAGLDTDAPLLDTDAPLPSFDLDFELLHPVTLVLGMLAALIKTFVTSRYLMSVDGKCNIFLLAHVVVVVASMVVTSSVMVVMIPVVVMSFVVAVVVGVGVVVGYMGVVVGHVGVLLTVVVILVLLLL